MIFLHTISTELQSFSTRTGIYLIVVMNSSLIKPEHIAPCGMNCALCQAFQRQKRTCPGCSGDDTNKPRSCRSCIIRNCPTIQKNSSHFCYECEEMPCKRLKQLDTRYRTKYGMSMIANLTEIQEKGIDAFLLHQTEIYTCQTCGKLLCVHGSRCLTCFP